MTERSSGRELWKTDGTAAGTVLVANITGNVNSSDPGLGVVYNNELYFSANDGVVGRELWKTDGTTVGTRIVIDLNGGPNAASSNPTLGTVASGSLYFAADNTGALPTDFTALWIGWTLLRPRTAEAEAMEQVDIRVYRDQLQAVYHFTISTLAGYPDA